MLPEDPNSIFTLNITLLDDDSMYINVNYPLDG